MNLNVFTAHLEKFDVIYNQKLISMEIYNVFIPEKDKYCGLLRRIEWSQYFPF